ncbi:MAG TPA: hypothetical protein VMU75_09960 [Acidimicrobiales bacterium]|nr:hypothetical protein [Acidimicrobiales bacterium]
MRDLRHELEQGAQEALYLLVGAGVLGLQRARSHQRSKGAADPLGPLASSLASTVANVLPEPLAEPLRAVCSLLGVPLRPAERRR